MSELGIDGGWTASADAWIALAPEHHTRTLLLDPVVLAEAGDVAGRRVLDLGCGEGRFSRLLAARGAITTGIDPIPPLLAAARAAAGPSEGYVLGTGERLPFADACFDLVVAYLCLIDIADFRAAIEESARVLRDGGRFIAANISNIASSAGDATYDADGRFLGYRVERYLDEFAMTLEFSGLRIRNWHRPLSAYMEAYLAAGFSLRRFIEPKPDDALRDDPRCESWFKVPTFDVMVWERQRPSSRAIHL